MSDPIIKLRPYQRVSFESMLGLLAMIYRRQSGKSFNLACIGLDWMMADVCDVIFASAALRLGTENIRKEAEVWRSYTEALRNHSQAGGAFKLTTSADDDGGELLDVDAIADLFEHQKLETKLWHSNATCSRSIVVAPNPDTAVGWTGHVIFDEVGRIPDFQDVYEAMEAIISSNPKLKIRMATTPPPDDAHYSYELLAPPAGIKFPVNPEGNFYTSEAGIPVHRVDAWDGYAAGVPLYDLKTREPMTPEEHRAVAVDRQAWDRNFGVKFISGGVSAISRLALLRAQEAGSNEGLGRNITEQLSFA